MAVTTMANLTCPECGFTQRLELPADACQFCHECTNFRRVLRPRPGECCVFCSYADARCPPKQSEQAGNDL